MQPWWDFLQKHYNNLFDPKILNGNVLSCSNTNISRLSLQEPTYCGKKKTKYHSFTSWERERDILWKVPERMCTGSKGSNHFKDGCVCLALSTPKQRVKTYVCHVVAECLAAYPQILTGKDVIQPLIEVAIRREPYVVEHRATTKHSRHGLWKEEKNNILSCSAFMKNLEFPVLRKSRPIVSKKKKNTSKRQGRGSQDSYHVLDVCMI